MVDCRVFDKIRPGERITVLFKDNRREEVIFNGHNCSLGTMHIERIGKGWKDTISLYDIKNIIKKKKR